MTFFVKMSTCCHVRIAFLSNQQITILSHLMDHSPIRQTFKLGKFISTAGKSIINLVKLGRLVAKYRKMWKIQSCEVCEFCILLYYARKSVTKCTFEKCG